MKFGRVLAASAAAVLLFVGLAGSTAGALAPPSNLNGQQFHKLATQDDALMQTQTSCDPTGTSSFSYQVTGTSDLPYSGTFHESGTATWGPQDPATGRAPLQSFSATFTINADDGTVVTGAKTLDLTAPFGPAFGDFGSSVDTGACKRPADIGYVAFFVAQTSSYSATIQTTDGAFHDQGTSYGFAQLFQFQPEQVCTVCPTRDTVFAEAFVSNQPVTPAGADTVTLSPVDATNTVGTNHTVTATATAAGQPVPAATVLFNVAGSDTASGFCTTNSAGQCSFTYAGPQLPGADIITGCADNNHNNAADAGEPCGQATKAWVLPSSTAGQSTGGGHLPATGHSVAFGFTARSNANGVSGECSVVDTGGADTKFKCLDVTALVQSANQATFFGDGTLNGVAATYRIDVTDNGEPGAGVDRFSIQTSSGYTASGTISNGNIQVH
jgi:hypothetical protein